MAQQDENSDRAHNSIMKTFSDIIYRLDTEGIITFVNDAVTEYGYSPKELVGTPILNLIHPKDMKKAAYRINERRSGDRSTKSLKLRLLTKKNTTAPFESGSKDAGKMPHLLITAEGLYDSNMPEGKIFKGTQGIVRNISERIQTHDQIEQQFELLSFLLDILPHPLYVIDACDYTIKLMNSSVHFNVLSKEVTCYSLIHKRTSPCCLSGLVCPLERVKDTKQPVKALKIHNDENGNPINFEIHAYPIFDNDGNVSQVIQYCLDINKFKQAEIAIQDSHEYAEDIVQSIRESLVILDSDLTVVYANRSFYEKFKVTKEETEGHSLWDLGNHQWNIPELREMLERILKENNAFENFEVEHHFHSLGPKIMLLNARRLFMKAKDSQLILLTIEDVTDRVQAERALKRSKEMYRHITQTISDYIYDIRMQDGIPKETIHGAGCVAVTGYTANEFKENQNLWIEMVHEQDRSMVLEKVGGILSGREVESFEHRIVRKDGAIRWLKNTPAPKFDDQGKLLTYHGVIQDITEQKKIEDQLKQAQRREAIGTLAGGIAHNFNNLLMTIQGNVSLMLLNINSNNPHYQKLKNIEQSVQSGAELAGQLLGFARGGKYEIKPTDLNALIKKQNRMFGHARKEIIVRGKYEENLWTVKVDQGQIEQVLLNLYFNAADAMPSGGELYIKTENVQFDINHFKRFPFEVKPGKYVKISVTDTGIGMDEETKRRIFEPFFTTKEVGQGTGLGLASVYGIIKNHDGIIDFSSEKGMGATFTIFLPASTEKVIKEENTQKELMRGKETILFVDDEDTVVQVGTEYLVTLGYNVIWANSGQEAIEIFRENHDKIHLVILDLIMPGVNGGETYDHLKKLNPNIKALLSSGYSIKGLAREILNRGCDGFIQKPYSLKDLSQKLREILDRK
jgi:two-component system, cell cycle sensor histidine kinase and response regulator CckA